MDAKVVKTFKNGNRLVEVSRVVTTTYRVWDGNEWGARPLKGEDVEVWWSKLSTRDILEDDPLALPIALATH